MSGLHQPHDKIVKATFSDIPTACAFLQAELPPELVSQIDWSTLRLESGSQIDAEFSASSSDLLYTARLGGEPAYLYVLFEHQSSEDPLIALVAQRLHGLEVLRDASGRNVFIQPMPPSARTVLGSGIGETLLEAGRA